MKKYLLLLLLPLIGFGQFNPIFFASGGQKAFISTWKTDNTSAGSSTSTQIKLPLISTGLYSFTVDWGDNSSDVITIWNQAQVTHTYSILGTYTIKIRGVCNGWQFNNTGDRLKILSIQSWGVLKLGSPIVPANYFHGCANLDLSSVSDVLNLTGISNFQNMFRGCTSLTTISRLNEWNTLAITSMEGMFFLCSNFNQSLSFNTSNVLQMINMFRSCLLLNSTLTFNTSSATSMQSMFMGCPLFNQPLSFNTANVADMSGMFNGATAFDQNIGSWLVGNVTNFTSFMLGKTPATFSTINLDAIYNGWSTLPSLKPTINITFGTAKYTAGSSSGRAILTGAPNNWTITDGGI